MVGLVGEILKTNKLF